MKGEEWRDVAGFPGYRVSSFGRVMSERQGKPKLLRIKPQPADHGRVHVGLRRDGKSYTCRVCRLVCEAFYGPRPEGMQVCHYPDKNPANNRLWNLRWDTPRENARDKIGHGTNIHGERHYAAKLTEAAVILIRSGVYAHLTDGKIGKLYGVSAKAIQKVREGESWAHVVVPKRRRFLNGWSQGGKRAISDPNRPKPAT